MTELERGCVLGVDIGGTFTDVVLVGAGGALSLGKTPTTPDDPCEGLLRGVEEVLSRTGTRPADIVRVAHATTLATNVILERKGPPVAFVTTRGFRSMLTLGRAARVEDQRFDLFFDVPEPPVPASHCFEVQERIGAGGVVLEALDEAAARGVADRVAALGVAGVAVCFLHAYANPVHEARMAALLRERLPEASVVASSEVWPELREYERATTTLMSAYVGPVMRGYLEDLTRRLAAIGIAAPVHIMESSGGVMSAALAARRAVYTIESGPAAGVMSALQLGRSLDLPDLLSFDMGGTTAKAGMVRGGRVEITRSFHVGGTGSFGGRREGTGLPIKVPAIDLAEVGAGGGSIAWVDAGGTLRVGPHSAGALPGPACYGLGGERPTVTDANLVLGYLDPAYFAGGSMPLHPDRSREALERHVCKPLGIDLSSAAHAIHQIANASMGSAVHVVTVQRGIDPRGFAMVALGGAGPAHAARVAERFGIDRVVVPFGSGVGSAIGLLATDVTTERTRTRPMRAAAVDFDGVSEIFDSLRAACLADLETPPERTQSERAVDMRYQGQAHELDIAAPDGAIDATWLAELVARFHARYAETFGRPLEAPAELVGFRVRVRVPVPRPALDPLAGSAETARQKASRPAFFEECGGHVETPVHERASLRAGDRVPGPALVEEPHSTLVVPPGWEAQVDPAGNLILGRGGNAAPSGEGQSGESQRALTAEILRNALRVAAEEASIVVVRAAYSTFIVEGSDASAAILDARGRLVAQSTATSLAHAASLRLCIEALLEDFSAQEMTPGDVYAMNDAYRGGIHANDLVIFQPIFVEGQVAYFGATLIHVSDLGGNAAGGLHATATDVFQEGLQLPPVKLADARGMLRDITRILALNSRTPDAVLGDVQALVAGTTVARRRVEALAREHGAAGLARGIDDYLAYSERLVRRDLAAFPDGTYRGHYPIDDDGIEIGVPHHVHVAITVEGDSAIVDFEGSSKQVAAAINSGYSQTVSGAIYALRCFLDPGIPMNEGCFTPFEMRIPRGSLLNPTPPVPTGGRFFAMYAVIDAIIEALSQALPERAIAASGLITPFSLSPARSRGEPWLHMAFDYGATGARRGKDGPDGTPLHFGLGRNMIPQVEPVELRCPLVIESVEPIPDSGGAGRWRGGNGTRTRFRVLEETVVSGRCDRHRIPPPGLDGGQAAQPGGYYRERADGAREALPDKFANARFAPGECFVVETSGGGGMGNPSERTPAEREADLAAGRTTR